MFVNIASIKVGMRIRKNPEGIKELAENISQVGLIHPISVDSEYNLLCGLRRLEACKLLGWNGIECKIFPLDVEADENLFRQEFTPEEKVKGLERIEEREKEKARERQGTRTDIKERFPEGYGEQTRDVVAKKVGWSGRTYEKAKAVIASGEEKLIDMMNREGNIASLYDIWYSVIGAKNGNRSKKAKAERIL